MIYKPKGVKMKLVRISHDCYINPDHITAVKHCMDVGDLKVLVFIGERSYISQYDLETTAKSIMAGKLKKSRKSKKMVPSKPRSKGPMIKQRGRQTKNK